MRPDKIRGNVFVANLPRGLKDEELAEAFDPFGIVLNAHMARDPATGETLGHGLVQLAPDKAVETAVARLNETGIGGRRIEARRADPDMGISPPPRLREAPARAPRAEAVVVERRPPPRTPTLVMAKLGPRPRRDAY
ncbi:MAG TPA: RNA-binding protein [Acetobacteraceae bacterium]